MAVHRHVLEPDHQPRHAPKHASPRPALRLVAPPSGRPGMAFVILSAVAVGALVLGLVVLNVLVAQQSFRLGDLHRSVEREQERAQHLRYAVSSADSPEAIDEAARRLGLVPPESQKFLVRPGDGGKGPDAASGEDTARDTAEEAGEGSR